MNDVMYSTRPLNGFQHKVTRSDTLASLALKYRVSEEEIKKVNPFLTNQSLTSKLYIQIPKNDGNDGNFGSFVENGKADGVYKGQTIGTLESPDFISSSSVDTIVEKSSKQSLSSFFESVDETVNTLFTSFVKDYGDRLDKVHFIRPDLESRLEKNTLYSYSSIPRPMERSLESTFDRPRNSRVSLDWSSRASSLFEPFDDGEDEGPLTELKELPLKSLYNVHVGDDGL